MNTFDNISIYFLYVGIFAFLFIFFETGYQFGKYIREHAGKKTDSSQGPMVGGVLVMLAFVLAFTFNIAASRFDARKQSIIEEVNTINTAYLQGDLVAEPYGSEIKRLLRQYVDVRLKAVEENMLETAIYESIELHKLLWVQVTLLVKQNPTSISSSLAQSINKIINLYEKRVNSALRDRIPGSIWLTLILITAFTMLTTGSQTGLIRTRRLVQVIPTVLAFATLVTLVVDLDRPAQLGQIKISHEAMVELQKKMDI